MKLANNPKTEIANGTFMSILYVLTIVFSIIGQPIMYSLCFLFTLLFAFGIFKFKNSVAISKYVNYIEINKTAISLFARPVLQKSKIIFANKFVTIEFNIKDIVTDKTKIRIIDKIKREEKTIFILHHMKDSYYKAFTDTLCNIMGYETMADDIMRLLEKRYIIYKVLDIKKIKKPIYLDINSASEAELTAIPGITIAQAKHIAKVRREKHGLLTMGQFFKAAKLEEEFIEQIKTSGNKILLSELPEYKRIIMKENE